MTNQEIRIAIASECGYRDCGLYNNPIDENKDWLSGIHPRLNLLQSLPNYTESLDVCAEFEKDVLDEYWKELANIVGKDNDGSAIDKFSIYIQCMKATPLQRCKAFLRVKGKWKK